MVHFILFYLSIHKKIKKLPIKRVFPIKHVLFAAFGLKIENNPKTQNKDFLFVLEYLKKLQVSY